MSEKVLTSSTTSSARSYSIVIDQEPYIDIDELECIIQQLEAISMGWGHDFGSVFTLEEINNIYQWERI